MKISDSYTKAQYRDTFNPFAALLNFRVILKTVVSFSLINEDEFFAFLNDFPIFDRNILWYAFCREKIWKELFHKSYVMGLK